MKYATALILLSAGLFAAAPAGANPTLQGGIGVAPGQPPPQKIGPSPATMQ